MSLVTIVASDNISYSQESCRVGSSSCIECGGILMENGKYIETGGAS